MEVLIILSLLIILALFPEPKFKKSGKKYKTLKRIIFITAVAVMILLVLSVLLK